METPIQFYERIRPTFEEAYDILGLTWRQALELDQRLFFSIVKRGSTEDAVEFVLDWAERHGVITLTNSLEEILDLHEDPDDVPLSPLVPLDEVDTPDWGIPMLPTPYPVDVRIPVHRDLPDDYRRVGILIFTDCDNCGLDYHEVVLVAREKEYCPRCAELWHQHELYRYEDGKRPLPPAPLRLCQRRYG